MPVTAKLSLAFYEKLGENVANELVDWFNAVDATYRSDLRELNELNFARVDAKMEQRISALGSELGVKMERLEARLDARIDRLAAALENKLDSQVAARAFAQIDARFDRMEARFETSEARFEASFQKGLRQNLAWSIVMWVSLLAAVIAIP
jgi:hypothetical protein